jgi:Zn-dependent protease with chaperone function
MSANVISGPGIFYDGMTASRHEASVELDPAMLNIRAAEGHLLARWPYGEIEELAAPDGLLRLGRRGNSVLARLEVRDPALAAAIDDLTLSVDRTGAVARRGRRRVVFWSLTATVSLVLAAVFGVPVLADLVAPLVPRAAERRLGDAVDAQVRGMLDPGRNGHPFECGKAEAERAGRAAFDRLMARLEGAAALPIPLHVSVVRRAEPNAFALPGGHIYVFEGLIDKSETPDELAGVLAHEMGHVAHRDGTRSVLQGAGLSFLFGMVLGDFVGGGAVVFAARAVLKSSYSREVETRADLYGVGLMARIGGDPRALGTILQRIAGANHPGMQILLDHPDTQKRVTAINAASTPKSPGALIEPAEWRALKRICAGS